MSDIPPSPDYDDDDWYPYPPNEITILKGTDTAYRLVLTCLACPEAWSVHLDEREVGYLRLRYGHFTARFPDHNGKMVFETTQIQGDGCFADEKERMRNLKKAITRIHREVKKEGR
jgi:hypothetical protein